MQVLTTTTLQTTMFASCWTPVLALFRPHHGQAPSWRRAPLAAHRRHCSRPRTSPHYIWASNTLIESHVLTCSTEICVHLGTTSTVPRCVSCNCRKVLIARRSLGPEQRRRSWHWGAPTSNRERTLACSCGVSASCMRPGFSPEGSPRVLRSAQAVKESESEGTPAFSKSTVGSMETSALHIGTMTTQPFSTDTLEWSISCCPSSCGTLSGRRAGSVGTPAVDQSLRHSVYLLFFQ